MKETVTFLASFPAIQSAIKLDGREGARIQLEIPESEVGNFISVLMWKGEVFQVTISRIIKKDDNQFKKYQ